MISCTGIRSAKGSVFVLSRIFSSFSSLMQFFSLPYQSSSISYCREGNGNKLLICFHGYAQSADAFSFLTQKIANDFTVIAIDLPFHGCTKWEEGLAFNMEDLLAILKMILEVQNLNFQKFFLAGFSMGGRLVLSMLERIPDKIEKAVLVAPDGLKLNFWYWLSTQTQLGNSLFFLVMQKPGAMLFLLKLMNRGKMVNRSIYKFISVYIFDEQVRKDLYNRWTTMKSFKPKIEKIKKIIRRHQIPVRLLYGEHDRIIRFERGEKFRKGIESYCEIRVLGTGHILLTKANTDTIADLLYN